LTTSAFPGSVGHVQRDWKELIRIGVFEVIEPTDVAGSTYDDVALTQDLFSKRSPEA